MKHILRLLPAVAMLISTSSVAQTWDKEKYPDYNPSFSNPDPALLKYGQAKTRKKARSLAASAGLPAYVNNAASMYFPPVFNQHGGSCGSASRIGYMFTHELNAYRGTDASDLKNCYPTHFVWLLTNGNSGKDQFVTSVGVPSAATYGGRTYSSLFGGQVETDNNFGWMTGYEKWLEGFSNRMHSPTSNPYSLGTEEGRLAAKAWLYNHAGDESFRVGGLIGLGVASGGTWERIPSTPSNDNIGVTNQYYVKKWGTQVDHAVTMVGYDDRIEFDLDGNGVFGEENKDEKGAWIIVNSWGGWCNNGFIYCPYAYAGATFGSDGNFNNSWWYGELYRTRKNYRPLRTIKLKMDYSRRSEILLQAGVSANLEAEAPENVIDMHHFRYAGDGHNGNTVPAPEIPMLGRWADGTLHTEPMEFGYDLTDLTSGFDRNQPLKYFFIVNTKSTAQGKGNIYNASIIDYEHDLEGVETPFDLGSAGKVEVRNAGEKTIISVVVAGAAFNAVENLALSGNTLTWDAPLASAHTLEGYAIYKDGVKLGTTTASVRTYALDGTGTYSVAALYENAVESAKKSVSSTVEKQAENYVINLNRGGFSIPGIFDSRYEECTIEFYIKPNSQVNWNNAFGPGWGSFFAHCNSTGHYNVGWNAEGHRITSSAKLVTNGWKHVTIVVNKNKMTLYFDNTPVGEITSNAFSGIGGFGNLVFNSQSGNSHYQDCSYDEIRIWKKARTAAEVKATYNREFYGDVMPDGLMAYYKGDLITEGGKTYLRDCVGGYHALLTNENFVSEKPAVSPKIYRPKDNPNILDINEPSLPVYAGVPVQLTTTRGDAIRSLVWNAPEAGLTNAHIVAPSLTFPNAGTYQVTVKGTDYEADGSSQVAREVNDTIQIQVLAAPAPDASFTTTATQVASGDRVSFHVTNPRSGYIYRWSMPGADVESASTVSAAATYQGAGTYTVKLTAIAPNGTQAEQTAQVVVENVKPVADFIVSDPVVLKGTTIGLADASKHKPTQLKWTLYGEVKNTIVNGGKTFDFLTSEPGIYDVKLEATNEKGTDSKTVNRAFIVTNADSKNGLNFSRTGAYVTMSKPITSSGSMQAFSLDWWMSPSKLGDYCLGIGHSTSTFMLRTDGTGRMFFHNGSRVVSSTKDYVVTGQWHHYAVTYQKGTVKFYRDGDLIYTATGAGSTLATPSSFAIGTSAAEMTGSIDEFRLWNCNLTQNIIRNLCNEPIANPEMYISGEKASYNLLLYYQFNQNGGDVTDLTSHANTGIRSGFGPDGDAWDLSKGVFCLNFGQQQADEVIDGLEDVEAGVSRRTAAQGVYTLSGLRVADNDNLSPGLYIQNGKKFVVK